VRFFFLLLTYSCFVFPPPSSVFVSVRDQWQLLSSGNGLPHLIFFFEVIALRLRKRPLRLPPPSRPQLCDAFLQKLHIFPRRLYFLPLLFLVGLFFFLPWRPHYPLSNFTSCLIPRVRAPPKDSTDTSFPC